MFGYVAAALGGWLFAVHNYASRHARRQARPPWTPTPREPVCRHIYMEPIVPGQRKTTFGTFNRKTHAFREGRYDSERRMLVHADGRTMSRKAFEMLPVTPRKTKRVIVGYIDAGAIPTPAAMREYRISAREAEEAGQYILDEHGNMGLEPTESEVNDE